MSREVPLVVRRKDGGVVGDELRFVSAVLGHETLSDDRRLLRAVA